VSLILLLSACRNDPGFSDPVYSNDLKISGIVKVGGTGLAEEKVNVFLTIDSSIQAVATTDLSGYYEFNHEMKDISAPFKLDFYPSREFADLVLKDDRGSIYKSKIFTRTSRHMHIDCDLLAPATLHIRLNNVQAFSDYQYGAVYLKKDLGSGRMLFSRSSNPNTSFSKTFNTH
jgi:hypothetical protein